MFISVVFRNAHSCRCIRQTHTQTGKKGNTQGIATGRVPEHHLKVAKQWDDVTMATVAHHQVPLCLPGIKEWQWLSPLISPPPYLHSIGACLSFCGIISIQVSYLERALINMYTLCSPETQQQQQQENCFNMEFWRMESQWGTVSLFIHICCSDSSSLLQSFKKWSHHSSATDDFFLAH